MTRRNLESPSAPSEVSGKSKDLPEGLQSFQVGQTSQTAVEPHKGRGRPSAVTPELFAQICDGIAEGLTLNQICRANEMPASSTVRRFIQRASKEIREQYAQARAIGIESLADDLVEIADDASQDVEEIETSNGTIVRANREFIERSKVRIDTRKWMLSKLAAHTYGDKIEQNITGNVTTRFTLEIGDGSVRERQAEKLSEPRVVFDLPKPKSADEIIEENL